jgi:cell division protein FtsN
MSKSKTSKYEIKLNKGQLIFSALALIVSLLLTYSLGVLTGMKFPYGTQHTDISPSAQNVPPKPSPSDQKHLDSFKTSRTEGDKTIHQFTFYDTLPKNTETPLVLEKKKAPAKNKKKRSSTKKAKAKEKGLDRGIVTLRYTIQLGSFQQKEKAYALQNKLKKQGYLAHVTPQKIENRGTWYRVRMGSFNSPKEAQKWVSKLGGISPPPFITSATD